jgi:hypothetical protein
MASSTASERIRLALRRAALQRNLRTAAVLGVAASGGLLGMGWLAATAGTTFAGLYTWRLLQLRSEGRDGGDDLIVASQTRRQNPSG